MRFLHPIESLVLPVLHFDPVLAATAAIGPIAMFRNQSLEAELAGFAEEIWSDFSLLKGIDEDPLRPTA